jgi:signal transduction histidine kinase
MCDDHDIVTDPKLRLYRSMFEHARDATMVFDRHGSALLLNRAARALPEELNGRLFARDGPHAAAVEGLRRELSARGQARADIVSGDRSLLVEGRVFGALYVITLRDATELRQREAELRALQRVETVGHFALALAHDMNNLLTPILFLSEHLRSDLPNSNARDMAHDIHSAAERAAGLTRQTLRLVRREPARVAPVEVNALMTELQPLVARVAGSQVQVEMALAPDAGCARLDRERLEHMLLNLVANARDAMPSGGRLVLGSSRVPLEETEEAGSAANGQNGDRDAPAERYVCLRVTDTGIGMTRDVRERIFERFFTTKEVGRGSGLGLDAVRRFVQASQGCIAVHSQPGCGTTVAIYFPAIASEREQGESDGSLRRSLEAAT